MLSAAAPAKPVGQRRGRKIGVNRKNGATGYCPVARVVICVAEGESAV